MIKSTRIAAVAAALSITPAMLPSPGSAACNGCTVNVPDGSLPARAYGEAIGGAVGSMAGGGVGGAVGTAVGTTAGGIPGGIGGGIVGGAAGTAAGDHAGTFYGGAAGGIREPVRTLRKPPLWRPAAPWNMLAPAHPSQYLNPWELAKQRPRARHILVAAALADRIADLSSTKCAGNLGPPAMCRSPRRWKFRFWGSSGVTGSPRLTNVGGNTHCPASIDLPGGQPQPPLESLSIAGRRLPVFVGT
jgi:hypothetical protein